MGRFAVQFYRSFLSGWLGGCCRFYPSCSCYAEEVLKNHSPVQAILLIARRLGRCHPFSKGGFDPAPVNKLKGGS